MTDLLSLKPHHLVDCIETRTTLLIISIGCCQVFANGFYKATRDAQLDRQGACRRTRFQSGWKIRFIAGPEGTHGYTIKLVYFTSIVVYDVYLHLRKIMNNINGIKLYILYRYIPHCIPTLKTRTTSIDAKGEQAAMSTNTNMIIPIRKERRKEKNTANR